MRTLAAACRSPALIGDSHAALFGHAAFEPGTVKATYGTGSSLMTPSPRAVRSRHGLSTTVAWALAGPSAYALEGNITMTGGAVDWFGQFLGGRTRPRRSADLAATVDDTAASTSCPAFAGLGAPHWDDHARGLICGLTRARPPHTSRGPRIESIAYQVRDVFDAMRRDAAAPVPLLADGGASRNDALMQFQADMLGVPGDPQRLRRPVRARRRLARGPGHGLLAVARRAGAPASYRRSLRAGDGVRANGTRAYAGWTDAVQRRSRADLQRRERLTNGAHSTSCV